MDYSINQLSTYLYLSSLYYRKKDDCRGLYAELYYAIIHALFSYF